MNGPCPRHGFDPWIARALAVRPGVGLEVLLDPSGGVPQALDIGGLAGRFVLVEATATVGEQVSPLALRVVSVGGPHTAREGVPFGHWQAEWTTLVGRKGLREGLLQHAATFQDPVECAPLLPPLYFCRERRAWVAAICADCTGPAPLIDPHVQPCATCGSPRGGSGRSKRKDALVALWERVQRGADAPDHAVDPGSARPQLPCLTCDRRHVCFPPTGPAGRAGSAEGVLAPLSPSPWGGLLVERFHLPFRTWLRLADGEPWHEVRRELPGQPPALREEQDGLLAGERRFVAGMPSGAAFGLEALLLRLEALRQLLSGVAGLSRDLGRPHLGIRAEAIGARLGHADTLRTPLWNARVALLDAAPGWREGEGEYEPPTDRPAALAPPGCSAGGGWTEGLCISRRPSGKATPGHDADFNFIADAPSEPPPQKGDLVEVVPVGGPAGSALGRIQVVFAEIFQVMLEPGEAAPEPVRRFILQGGREGARIRVRVVRDHSLADDLFALGTLWFSTLLRSAGDAGAAASLRDRLARQAGGPRPSVTDAAFRDLVLAAEATGDLAFRTGATGEGHLLPPEILGEALVLGLDLCGAFRGSYPGQGHEPVAPAERARVHAGFLDRIDDLAGRARDRLFGPQDGAAELLAALETYACERFPRPGTL